MMRTKVLMPAVLVLMSIYTPVISAQSGTECDSETTLNAAASFANKPLPVREGPRVQTTGSVPHQQLSVSSTAELNEVLFKLAFALPGLEGRPTIVSLPGATGMWLKDSVPVKHAKVILRGREFAHIHTDGSLHAPLPLKRALELEEKGWGERHPWADRNDGWEGLVMLYSATNNDELKTLIQLITESYNHVTGTRTPVPGC